MRVLQYYSILKGLFSGNALLATISGVFLCEIRRYICDVCELYNINDYSGLCACAFTSSSRRRGDVLVLAETLRRLSISSIRMKSHTGFLVWWLLNVSSTSLFMHGSPTPWEKWPLQWIRPDRLGLLGFHEIQSNTQTSEPSRGNTTPASAWRNSGDAHSGSLGWRLWRRQRNCITLAGSCNSHDASVPDMRFVGGKGC